MKKLESAKVYHSPENKAVGSSILKKIAKTTLLHALSAKTEETDSMRMGSGLHTATLEPETFKNEFIVAPKCDRRTKEGKAIYEAFLSTSEGKTVLSDDQMEIIQGMKDSILSHPVARAMLSGGEAEYSYYAEDPITGIVRKCRPDYHNGGALIDVKSTQDASFEAFAKQVGNLGYHIQAAYYLDTFNASQGTDYKDFFFIAVENKAPFAVAVYRLPEKYIEQGRIEYKKALKALSDFLKSGASVDDLQTLRNFGYPTDILDIEIPYYVLNKAELA
jgi:exodeoxyribonuclease VIII